MHSGTCFSLILNNNLVKKYKSMIHLRMSIILMRNLGSGVFSSNLSARRIPVRILPSIRLNFRMRQGADPFCYFSSSGPEWHNTYAPLSLSGSGWCSAGGCVSHVQREPPAFSLHNSSQISVVKWEKRIWVRITFHGYNLDRRRRHRHWFRD